MSLAVLFNVPNDENELLIFALSNMDHHRLIATAMHSQKGIEVPIFPLDPVPLTPDAIETWAQNHQQMHTDFTSALGISGVDLSDVNFKDPTQLSAWAILHANEHRLADEKLGLGQ